MPKTGQVKASSVYIQFKHGFIEADHWDESRDLPKDHLRLLDNELTITGDVIIVRSRQVETLEWVKSIVDRRILDTPKWDYRFRMYMSSCHWVIALTKIAEDLDYRNFKKWCLANSTDDRAALASDIWGCALALRSDI